MMQKWNIEKKQYEPYEVPDTWYCPMYAKTDTTIINCTSCGDELEYGRSYTSKLIHDFLGFGYPVCGHCHKEEYREYLQEIKRCK